MSELKLIQRRQVTAEKGNLKAIIHSGPEGSTIKLIDMSPRGREHGPTPNQMDVTPALLRELHDFTRAIQEVL